MTAEIAVLNKYGIALAADSAVSIGASKIYNSANKLFALTKHHPVGVMVYGNAHFMGIPWETIIKYYRLNVLKDRQLPTIKNYMEEFLGFLSTSPIFTEEGEAEYVRQLVSVTLYKLIKNIKGRVDAVIHEEGKISKQNTEKLVNQLVKDWLTQQNEVQAGFPRGARSMLEKKYAKVIEAIATEMFQNLPISSRLQSTVRNALLEGIGREINTLSPSGLVVAGFGEDEVFPSVSSLRIDGKIGRHLRILKRSEQSVSMNNRAIIIPFAQREMVDLFMQGADPHLHQAILHAVGGILGCIDQKISECIGVNIGDKEKAAIQAEMSKIHDDLFQRLHSIQKRRFVDPVLNGVASLPLDELAAMAESLVNLTTFKRRVTPVPESVGGPV
ncbi:hypothetical protein PQR36_19695, partial [Paraburkholderia nemoris]|uniref:hypothetical protein n=1 Tax=Paraburkholderia nemoris TaxID=2793076 RepID=UPI0038BB2419